MMTLQSQATIELVKDRYRGDSVLQITLGSLKEQFIYERPFGVLGSPSGSTFEGGHHHSGSAAAGQTNFG